MEGDIRIAGEDYRVDLSSYRVKDILDFAPRASVPGGSVIMSDLGMYQPLVQSDFRHGIGFHWYSDASGYMRTVGDMDTRQNGIAMRYTQKTSSDTDNNAKNGFTNFGGYLWAWGEGGLRKYDGTSWDDHSFSGIEIYNTSQAAGSATDSLSFQHTVPSIGQNKMLVVELSIRTDVAVSSVTYGGVALTQKSAVGTAPTAEIWYLLSPTAGTADVVVTLASATTVLAGATSYLYVDQTTPFGTAATTSGTGTSSTVSVTSATGQLVIDVLAKQGPSTDILTINENQTSNWLQSIDTATSAEGAGSYRDGAASVDMAWSWTNSRAYAAIGIAIIPASQPVSGTVNFAFNGGDYLFYCQDGQRIRKISTSLVDSATGVNASSTDYSWMVMHNGAIYAGKDDTNRVHYSTEVDLSDLEGGTDDVSLISVGTGDLPTLGAIVYAGNLYVSRRDGLFHIGEDYIARRVVDYSNESSSVNFRSMAVVNGFLIYPIRDRLIQWNSVRVNDITPERVTDTFPYVTYGRFSHFIAADNFLYMVARTNEDPFVEALLCYDGTGFHKLSDLCTGTDNVTALGYDTDNNRLWWHLDATNDVTYYIQLQSNSPFPYANFSTSGQHSLITSRMDMGFRRVIKSMTSLIMEVENVTVDRYIQVYYQLEGDGTWYEWDKVTSNGTFVLENPGGSNTKEFYFAQLRFDFVTDSTSQSPILNAYTIRFIMRPDVEFGWNFNIIAASGARQENQSDSELSSSDILQTIRELRNSKAPVEFVDVLGDTYTGYITALTETPVYRRDSHDGEIPDVEYTVNVNFVSVGG